MADRLPERPAAALARTALRPRYRADHLGVPGRVAERGTAAQGTDARQRPRVVARGRVERGPADDRIPLVSPEDVRPRFIDRAGISDRTDRDAAQRRCDFPGAGIAAH